MSDEEKQRIVDEKLIKLNIEEMAEQCDCTPETMRKRIANDKEFPAFRIGRETYCLLTAFAEYLSQRRI